jgi:hypothetical protein
MGAGAVRLIVQPLTDRFELCARLGLVVTPGKHAELMTASGRFASIRISDLFSELNAKVIHAVLRNSPSARAGLEPHDIVITLNGAPWDAVRFLTLSDRQSSEIVLKTFVGRYCKFASIRVRVLPEPYRPIADIIAEATDIVAASPMPLPLRYVHPRLDDLRETLAMLRGRRRR